jgi:hypothetical protein
MTRIDLRLFALRLKVLEMLQRYARQRQLRESHPRWRHLILPN